MSINILGMPISSKFLGWIGAIAFVACLVSNAFTDKSLDTPGADTVTCTVDPKEKPAETPEGDDKLSIIKVEPGTVTFGRTMCIKISGVGTAQGQKLYLYLNNDQVPGVVFQPRNIDGVQALKFEIGTLETPEHEEAQQKAADQKTTDFWRKLLNQNAFSPTIKLRVGLSRTSTAVPQITAPAIDFLVFDWLTLGFGLFALVCAGALLWIFARTSSLLRDSAEIFDQNHLQALRAKAEVDLAEARIADKNGLTASGQAALVDPDPAISGPALKAQDFRLQGNLARLAELDGLISKNETLPSTFSLAKTQMAFWLLLTTACYIFIWLTTGQQSGLFNAEILTLLGINAATSLAAISIGAGAKAGSPSRGFLNDILNDSTGPQLSRIQAAAWTVILGVMFLWTVATSFNFPKFDPMLLVLMGMSGTFYLGTKWQQPPPQ